MKHLAIKIFTSFLFLFAVFFANAQKNFFTDVAARPVNPGEKTTVELEKKRNLSLDTLGLLNFFQTLQTEKNISNYKNAAVLEIPMPDGTINKFHIWESTIMEPVLAAKFPSLKTYVGQGIDDSSATIKLDWTSFGFHAMILSPVTGSVFIDPYIQGNKTLYISYFKSDVSERGTFTEPELKNNKSTFILDRPAQILSGPQCVGPQLLTYRLAVACTGEYAVAATGLSTPSVVQTLSAILTTVNRVDGVYKTELDIHFVLVANEDHIIFTKPSTDPFTGNDDPNILINQSQEIIDDSIGNANYDIGHTFSTGAGGLSSIGVVCQSSLKASSVTGLSNPVGDPFSIDYVAHEIGHEFGAHHPFNSNTSFCGSAGQQSNTTNDEPGSGSTIMAYAEGPIGSGLCGSDNLQLHSDPYFNGINFDEITQYAFNGSGNSCPVTTLTGNNAPIAIAGIAYTIPTSTPFILTGNATDPDGDAVTYCWEQVDVGGPFGAWNMPSGDAPAFRSFLPVSSASRLFPQLSDVINNTTTIGEILPSYARTMHFRLTARDNKASGGGVCFSETSVTTINNAAPFKVTYPDVKNIKWNGGTTETVNWNPAGTMSAPISCINVMIVLSTDGGVTYPYVLTASAANSGTAQIQVPSIETNQARIKVMSVGNIFYDISDNDFAIQVAPLWKIYPNPSNTGTVSAVNNFDNTNVEIELFTVAGKLVYKSFAGTVPAGNVIPIPTDQFQKGVYILKIHGDSMSKTQKVLLQ
jgi:hypothetical protein